MAQQYFRKKKEGAREAMVGLNTKTEPRALIVAGFLVLERLLGTPQQYATNAGVMLSEMYGGSDLSLAKFNAFLAEYEAVIGSPVMTEYGRASIPLVLGKGARHKPKKKNCTEDDWLEFNNERYKIWVKLIRDELDRRGWSLDYIQTQFRVSMPDLPESEVLFLNKQSGTDRILSVLKQMNRRVVQVRVNQDMAKASQEQDREELQCRLDRLTREYDQLSQNVVQILAILSGLVKDTAVAA